MGCFTNYAYYFMNVISYKLYVMAAFLFFNSCQSVHDESFFFNFNQDSLKNKNNICSESYAPEQFYACTGKNNEFSYTISFPLNEILKKGFVKAAISCDIMNGGKGDDGRWVVSLEPVFNESFYKETWIKYHAPIPGKWFSVNEVIIFPDNISDGTELKIYIWSPDKNKYFMDNLSVKFRSKTN